MMFSNWDAAVACAALAAVGCLLIALATGARAVRARRSSNTALRVRPSPR
jgi:uncharacterized integral membrane protein